MGLFLPDGSQGRSQPLPGLLSWTAAAFSHSLPCVPGSPPAALGLPVVVKQYFTGILSVLGTLRLREPSHLPLKQSQHQAVELPGQQTAPLLQPLPGMVRT